jgi:nitrogen PTS system EIIA component
MQTIFLSYSRSDEPAATAVHDALLRGGIMPWMDIEGLKPGLRWSPEIEFAIERCSFFSVLVSSNSMREDSYVHKEVAKALDANLASKEGKPTIIPMRLDGSPARDERLNQFQHIDASQNLQDGIRALISTIGPSSQQAMGINSIFTPQSVITGLRCRDKDDALKHPSRTASELLGVDWKTLYMPLAQREQLGSTGVGDGIATPHARIPGLSTGLLLFAKLDEGIEFNSFDGKRVNIIFAFFFAENVDTRGSLVFMMRLMKNEPLQQHLRRPLGNEELFQLIASEMIKIELGRKENAEKASEPPPGDSFGHRLIALLRRRK